MWQPRRSYMVMISGLLGMALVAASRGARASDACLLPSLLALQGPVSAGPPPLPRSDARGADLIDALAAKVTIADPLSARLRPEWNEALFSDACSLDTLPAASNAAPLPSLSGFPAALAEIRAAAAGSWSLDGRGATGDALRRPEARPAPKPAPPLLPVAPTAPDLRALLATAAVPACGLPGIAALLFPLRRRGRRITGALSERLSTGLGLLLIIIWGTLRMRE